MHISGTGKLFLISFIILFHLSQTAYGAETLTYRDSDDTTTRYEKSEEGIYLNQIKEHRLIRDKFGNLTEFGIVKYSPSSIWLPETETLKVKQKYKGTYYRIAPSKIVGTRKCKIKKRNSVRVGAGEYDAWIVRCTNLLFTDKTPWRENIWFSTDKSRTLLKYERVAPDKNYTIELTDWLQE